MQLQRQNTQPAVPRALPLDAAVTALGPRSIEDALQVLQLADNEGDRDTADYRRAYVHAVEWVDASPAPLQSQLHHLLWPLFVRVWLRIGPSDEAAAFLRVYGARFHTDPRHTTLLAHMSTMSSAGHLDEQAAWIRGKWAVGLTEAGWQALLSLVRPTSTDADKQDDVSVTIFRNILHKYVNIFGIFIQRVDLLQNLCSG